MAIRDRAESEMPASVHAVAFVFVALMSAEAHAASFDCRRASASVEKTICSNAELSSLDDTLGTTYSAALKLESKGSMILAQQKKWLAATRNRCREVSCLRDVYKAQIEWLKAQIVEPGSKCQVEESQLIGHWARESDGEFEEFYVMAENGERPFASWLHNAPEYLGTWRLSNCTLHLENDNRSNPSFDYKVLGFQQSILYLQDTDDRTTSSYRKLKR